MLSSKCAICGSKKSRFSKEEQEAKGLLSNLERKKERIQKFILTGDTNYIYRIDLDKACFQHDLAYGKYKDLERRTQSNKVKKDTITKKQSF